MCAAPLILRIGRTLERRQIRGGTRLLRVVSRWLPDVVNYPLSPTVSVRIPVTRESTRWDDRDVADYERDFIAAMVQAARSLPRPLHLIDVGADIGLFALKLYAQLPCQAITAYEPNPRAFPYLRANLEQLAHVCVAEARREGASNRSGLGRLCRPAHDADDHAQFVSIDEHGDFPVTRIDDHLIPKHAVILKIDTEGTELEVLQGAANTLAEAPDAVVGFEVHADVIARTRTDPLEVIHALPEWDRWSVVIAEHPGVILDTNRAIAPQLGRWKIVNLVCVRSSGLR